MGFLSVLGSALLYATSAQALGSAGWRQQSIYQALTDRYATTDGSSPSCFIRNYCGGTWRGMINKLDYIQGMGFTSVWISPVIHNLEVNTTYGQAFHGYWGDNPYTLNPHFGTSQDLKDLSDALHKRGMYLIVDIVINHLTSNAPSSQVDFSLFPKPFNTAAAFHQDCSINYNNQSSIQDCWLVSGNNPPNLADVKSEDPVVYGAMVQSVVDIVKNYSVDGIRLDTARHVPKPQLMQFQNAVGVWVTGEVATSDYAYMAQYQAPVGPIASCLNYPMFTLIQQTFTGLTTFDWIASAVVAQNKLFSDPNGLATFIDNHDQPRMASQTGDDVMRDMNAAAFTFFSAGLPVIYYGFEQRFNGGYDPVNRETLWTSGYNTAAPLYQYIAKLHQIKNLAAKSFGRAAYYNNLVSVLGNSDIYMAFQRGPLVVVVTNVGISPSISEPNAAANGTVPAYQVTGSQFSRNEAIVDLLSCQTTMVGGNGRFTSPAAGGAARIWIAQSAAGPLCAGKYSAVEA